MDRIEYLVDSPHTSKRRQQRYPLTRVVIERLDEPVVTTMGETDGVAIVAHVYFHNGKHMRGHTVWAPERDKDGNPTWLYDFELGCRIALRRALEESETQEVNVSPKMKKSIWAGLNAQFAVK